MTVLVTGGAGFIGSHLVDQLVLRGHEIVVLDNLDAQVHGPDADGPVHIADPIGSGQVQFMRGDVTDRDAVEKALSGVEVLVHLAAAVGVGQSMYEPHYYVHTNCGGTGMLLDVLARRKPLVKKLIVASSMSLYGEGASRCLACGRDKALPRSEELLRAGRFELSCRACGADMEPLPTPETKEAQIESVYAATKKHQEDLFVSFGRAYGIPTFALRFFNVFGPRQSLGNPYTGVAAIFLSRLLNGNRPLLFEDGLQSRDFVDVRDVARALLLAVEHEGGGVHVLNVGTGRRQTVAQVAETLALQLGVSLPSERLGQSRAGDIRHCFADPTAARQALGFAAEYTFASGLPALIGWCRSQTADDRVSESLEPLKSRGLIR